MTRDPVPLAVDPAILLDQLATAILAVDAGAVVRWLNTAAADLLAISPAAARGRRLASLVANGGALEALIVRSRSSGEPIALRGFELAPVARADSRHQVDLSLTPSTDGGVLVEIADTTQPSRITRDTALLAQQGGSRLMARQLAHEVKNPLGGLRGAAQLLERELADANLREYTSVIIREADRLTGLVDSMSGPGRPPHKTTVNIHEICEHVRHLLRAEAPESVQIELDYDPSVPNALIDRHQIIQALLNIARNALQALGTSGRMVLRTRTLSNVSIGPARYRLVASV